MSAGVVYLLHFDRRVREHQCGRGARLVEVVIGAGISLELARTWTGDRKVERLLKNRKAAPRLCPLCSPARRQARRIPS